MFIFCYWCDVSFSLCFITDYCLNIRKLGWISLIDFFFPIYNYYLPEHSWAMLQRVRKWLLYVLTVLFFTKIWIHNSEICFILHVDILYYKLLNNGNSSCCRIPGRSIHFHHVHTTFSPSNGVTYVCSKTQRVSICLCPLKLCIYEK